MENFYERLLKGLCVFATAVLILCSFANKIYAQSSSIELRKYINGMDLSSLILEIPVGEEIIWHYVITNNGDTNLTDILVTDDQGVLVVCPSNSLAPGDSMICEGRGVATEGLYENLGIVEAFDENGIQVIAEDNSSYIGIIDDSDGDGIYDDIDQCIDSELNATIIIDGCETSVDNMLLENGCTMVDLIAQCAENANNHGKFVKCVSKLTNQWKKKHLISGEDKGAIQSCAAQSDIP